jgi:predicted AAA+ superfamily ATPase
MRDILIENTERFADGLPANNALLWGARGMGKSSLVKATHANINIDRKPADRLKLIEIHREDIESLPGLMDLCAAPISASSCSATTSPSTATTPPTNR